MADENPKSNTPKWRVVVEFITKEFAKHVLGIILVTYVGAQLVILLLTTAVTWVAAHWLLLAVLLTVVALVALVVWQFLVIRRLRRDFVRATAPRGRRPFEPIRVEDPAARLHWLLRRSPEEWRYYNVASSISPGDIQGILDGPFCSIDNCAARMEDSRSGTAHATFTAKCPTCGTKTVDVTTVQDGYTHTSDLQIWPMRQQAFAEMQRLLRAGTKIEGPIINMGRPQYWGRLRMSRR